MDQFYPLGTSLDNGIVNTSGEYRQLGNIVCQVESSTPDVERLFARSTAAGPEAYFQYKGGDTSRMSSVRINSA
jgi:hypothetical protein